MPDLANTRHDGGALDESGCLVDATLAWPRVVVTRLVRPYAARASKRWQLAIAMVSARRQHPRGEPS